MINPNHSFVETLLMDYMKQILSDPEFDNLLCDRLDHQPLGLYEWSNDTPYVTHEEVRGKLITNYLNKAITNSDLNTSSTVSNKRNLLSNPRNSSSQQSHLSGRAKKDDKEVDNIFNESQENKIEDKYMGELIDKFKYTIPEVNEKILLVNENTKNLVGSILENTVYNIVAEAVYGETDLSEKTKIYFFKK
jgi:hypothetical protein